MSSIVRSSDSTLVAHEVWRFAAAFEEVSNELCDIPVGDLMRIGLDIPNAVVAVLGRAPHIRSFRSEVVQRLPDTNLVSFDRLETFAMAMGHAHSLYIGASEAELPLAHWGRRLQRLRSVLLSDVDALCAHGFLDPATTHKLSGSTAYKDLAFDVMLLVQVMRNSWATIKDKTAVGEAALAQADLLAQELAKGLGRREQKCGNTDRLRDTRVRAYTRLVSAYEEVRRALSYLRWYPGDVDQIAPSLFAKRSNKGRAKRK